MVSSTRFTCGALLLCAIASLASVPHPDWQQDDASPILRATLSEVRLRYGVVRDSADTIVIKVDPTVFGSGERISGSGTVDHSAPQLAAMNVAGASAVVSSERARTCSTNAPDDCLESGRSVVVSISAPVVAGDSASIEIMVRISGKSQTVDSSMTMGRHQGIVHVTMRINTGTIARAYLRRVDGLWSVSRFAVLAQN